MSNFELNSILFYADFLSLKDRSIPITQPCKYFFVHGYPVNAAYIAQVFPDVDIMNKYWLQASSEYKMLQDKFGQDGVDSFINSICSIQSSGMVDAERLLKYIHQFSSKSERKQALKTYYDYINSLKYTHITINEDGDPQETECTRYVEHAEKVLERRGIRKSLKIDGDSVEEQVEIPPIS